MSKRMNDIARPKSWQKSAAEFLFKIWYNHKTGFVFLATRKNGNQNWEEHCFMLPLPKGKLARHFRNYDRDEHDHYFCPNAFNARKRKAVNALPTPYSWVDIDDADPNEFNPQPNILIKTSPSRYQGIWVQSETIPAADAEMYSKGLAYKYGADKNGWSSTKYLRVPFTKNHKPHYKEPIVKLVHFNSDPTDRDLVPVDTSELKRSATPVIRIHNEKPNRSTLKNLLRKYKKDMHPRLKFLINSDRAYGFERDRSKCIYEIVVGLYELGVTQQQIADVLWFNPYFQSKHGPDANQLADELARIYTKIGVNS